jgi:hypothetical protein
MVVARSTGSTRVAVVALATLFVACNRGLADTARETRAAAVLFQEFETVVHA